MSCGQGTGTPRKVGACPMNRISVVPMGRNQANQWTISDHIGVARRVEAHQSLGLHLDAHFLKNANGDGGAVLPLVRQEPAKVSRSHAAQEAEAVTLGEPEEPEEPEGALPVEAQVGRRRLVVAEATPVFYCCQMTRIPGGLRLRIR